MSVETTYSDLRGNLASYLDQVTDDREVVIVRRRGARDVALIAADELAGILETAHLLRSSANALRLTESLNEMNAGLAEASTWEQLRNSLNLAPRA